MERAAAGRLIRKCGWLSGQSAELAEQVLSLARLVELGPDRYPFHPGDEPGGVYGIVTGGVAVHLSGQDGEMHFVDVVRQGTWFGYGPIVRGGPRSLLLSFVTIEPTLLFVVGLADLQALAARSPAHNGALMTLGDYGFECAAKVVDALIRRNPEQRIAATLARVCSPAEEGANPCSGVIRLKQQQIGELAACERKLVNRVLRKFALQGLIEIGYGKILIRDRDALRALAPN